ncbi:MAG: hypothetical protein WAU77_14390 [Solirubrobacteraceae bacterium]
MPRTLLACAAVALSVAGACGCGAARSTAGVETTATSSPFSLAELAKRDQDGDIDRLTQSRYDDDNDAIPGFGQPADAADRRAIVALIKRYYIAAAAGDGAKACSMQYALTAELLVEEHHRGKGPASLRGGTCARIMSKLLAQHHRELAEDVSGGYRVLAVQVHLNQGYALVRFAAPRELHELRELRMLVHREHGGWKMDRPLDDGPQ